MPYKKTLHDITCRLLESEDDDGSVHQAADQLFRLFQSVSKQDWKDSRHRDELTSKGGKAIGSVWAAMCIKDSYRTKKFLRGLYLAILRMQQKRPRNEAVHILYAGTGPFATLAIPLTTVFKAGEIQFTFLEINPESVQSLHKVIDVFDAQPYVRALVQCDATTFQIEPGTRVDILITETMLPALQDEPQVAVTLNLAPQLAPDGILIPENIAVHAGLLNPRRNMERMLDLENKIRDHYFLLRPIFEWNKQTALQQVEANNAGVFPEVTVEIPQDVSAVYRLLCLFTKIQVFESEVLDYWQCHLSQPAPLMMLELEKKPLQKASFQYQCKKPGFRWELF